MARTAQIYELILAANATETLLVEGGFYKVLAASADIKISREGGSAIGPMQPGQGERINFRRLTIQNLSASANTVDILVADDSFVDTRIYGAVQVIDGGRLLTQNNQAFGAVGSQAASVGNFSTVGLYNPIANTKWAAVSKIVISSNSATPIFHTRVNTVFLTTLVALGVSKLGSGANSVMQVRIDATAAAPGGSGITFAWGTQAMPFVIETKEPILLPPNWGITVTNQVTNSMIGASFDYTEFVP